jgi:glycerol-3-phosphate acyltransferase PlsY
MTLFTIGVVALLFVKHRSNIARIWTGTENRVNFRGPRPQPNGQAHPSGRIKLLLLVVLVFLSAVASAGLWVYHHANQAVEVTAGPWTLRETDRVYSGQQRVDRIAFAAGGTRLAATCPRYERVVIYQVESSSHLKELKVTELKGRPVAIASNGDHFLVLVRPSGDRRHLEPGWWETFDLQGNRIGQRTLTGYYPDDFVVSPDGKYLVVIESGQSEGDAQKPPPSLEVIATDFQTNSHRVVGRLEFNNGDDPERISISASGQTAAVLLANSKQVAAIDLSHPESPQLVTQTKPTGAEIPYISYSSETDWIMMPVAAPSEGVVIDLQHSKGLARAESTTNTVPNADYVVCTRQKDSVLELFQSSRDYSVSLGRLPLHGPLNLGRTRPTGLAYPPEVGLLAVATRSGTIHVIELFPRTDPIEARPSRVAVTHSEKLKK